MNGFHGSLEIIALILVIFQGLLEMPFSVLKMLNIFFLGFNLEYF